mmetsp:Transcript_15987/g.22435  ORF Transcript_15987/g.22435 Transcript_15987/m.22435 type:complete len:96 (-) Transcript_15987:400-687(-)
MSWGGKLGISQYQNPKNYSAIWLGDTATYPLLVVVGFGGALTTYFVGRMFTQAPHITWSKQRRMESINEGSQREAETTNYYNHALRRLGKAKVLD